jgi:hypothetical protein
MTWVDTEPDIYTFLVSKDKKLAGYLDAIPVTDDFFGKVCIGEKKENDITPKDIVAYVEDAPVKLYVTSLALSKWVRQNQMGLYSEPLERLVSGFLAKIIRLAHSYRLRVTDIVAEGWTPEGQKWCEFFGMSSGTKDGMGHPIYCLKINESSLARAAKRFDLVKELLEAYRQLERRSAGD